MKTDSRGRFLAGGIPWNRGKPMSSLAKLRESRTKRLLFKLGMLKGPRKGVKLSKEIIEKISIAKKLFYRKHPENAIEHSSHMKKFWKKHPEKVEERRKFLIKLWKNPEKRIRARKIGIEVYRDHPELRQKSRKRFIKWLIENKNALRYIEQGKGNKYSLRRITENGEKVRSLYEVIVANWLSEHNIKYFYEGKMLIFPNYKKLGIVFTVPDFFLPEYNSLIEIYGGFRGTRNKNIQKSQAYVHYGIPFLALTPSDIKNLDYEIPKFLKGVGKNPKIGAGARKIMWGMLD